MRQKGRRSNKSQEVDADWKKEKNRKNKRGGEEEEQEKVGGKGLVEVVL